jgi:hypothetical protein
MMKQQTWASLPSRGRLGMNSSLIKKIRFNMHYNYSQSQTENESLNSHDVILPHHFVKHVNALVNVLTFARIGKFINQEVAECTQVAAQTSGAYAFDALVSYGIDTFRFKKLLPQQAKEKWRIV